MIVFDTETTGLIGHVSLPLEQQPEIIELTAVKLDDKTFVLRDSISFLVKPTRLPLPEVIVKITGITDAMLANELPFIRHLDAVTTFFLGERTAVAHNCAYDIGMLELELRRLARVTAFPWPPVQLCSVDLTRDLQGHRLKLSELYEVATGKKMTEAHRSDADVGALIDIVRWMREEGRL